MYRRYAQCDGDVFPKNIPVPQKFHKSVLRIFREVIGDFAHLRTESAKVSKTVQFMNEICRHQYVSNCIEFS